MDLSQYTESLRRELTSVTRFAGEDVARAAEMLAETLDSSVRLALLDVLSAAADEITASLDGATIDVRLSGTNPEFLVSITQAAEDSLADGSVPEEAGTARITLRMSEGLKTRVEAAAADSSMSVNAWLVRVISRASGAPKPLPPFTSPPPAKPGRGNRITGFARS